MQQSPVRTLTGGAEAMRSLSEEINRKKASMVIIVETKVDRREIRGYLTYRKGRLAEALMKVTSGDGGSETATGREAFRAVWREALQETCRIRVYTLPESDDEVNETERRVLTKKIKRMVSAGNRSQFDEKIIEWKSEGFNVEKLLEMNEGKDTENIIGELERRIERLRELRRISIQYLPRVEIETMREERALLSDPLRLEEAERWVEGLVHRRGMKEEGREKGSPGDDYGEIYHIVFDSDSNICPRCGKQSISGTCTSCGFVSINERLLEPRDMNMLFSNYVVWPGNKFCHAAAWSAANGDGQYNPLFIHAPAGMGKTHLLTAISFRVKDVRSPAKVIYVNAETMSWMETLKEKEELMRNLLGADLLLIDDLNMLAGKTDLQSFLLQACNKLLGMGRQVIAASDKAPQNMEGMDRQFISKLTSGLVVDIAPANADARRKILEMCANRAGFALQPQVLDYIARGVDANIRELVSAFNRIVAYSSLMKMPPTLENARKVIGHEGDRARAREIRRGHSYIVEEARAELCHVIAGERAVEGWAVLDITRTNPERLAGRFAALSSSRIVWLTDRESEKKATLEPSLEKIEYEIKNFLKMSYAARKGTLVVVDDLQYVISNTNFEGTVRLLRRIADEMSEQGGVLIVSVGQDTLSKQEIAILEREMELLI